MQESEQAYGVHMSDEQVLRRFWTTLVLYDIIREKPLAAIARKFSLQQGDVQR